ncbi:response regulator [Halapricum sp. CBA1109]|uniref:response regulator n=1 Tax=Halapricum sp. CBA1109 TaxID=2668068 RepID=UPI0018D24989|nr:response regulator [Halapricum sp. CBA1109]
MTAFGTPRVLVVDPDADDRAAAADALTASDTPGPEAAVTAVASVEAARDALDSGDIDCLVTEYDFPEENGLGLVEWVRDTDPDVPCILYTDATPEEIRTAAFETVVVEYLPKEMPDSAVALSRLVGNVVGQHGQLAYPIPENEDERLAAIEQYDVEGMEANDTIERITDLVAESFASGPSSPASSTPTRSGFWPVTASTGRPSTARTPSVPTPSSKTTTWSSRRPVRRPFRRGRGPRRPEDSILRRRPAEDAGRPPHRCAVSHPRRATGLQ